MKAYLFIFLTGFVIGFAIACVNIFSQRNDAENIILFALKSSCLVLEEKDCKVRLDTGEHQYTYSISAGTIATDNYTKKTKKNIIEDTPELYKATGLSTSISVATLTILKNEKAIADSRTV